MKSSTTTKGKKKHTQKMGKRTEKHKTKKKVNHVLEAF